MQYNRASAMRCVPVRGVGVGVQRDVVYAVRGVPVRGVGVQRDVVCAVRGVPVRGVGVQRDVVCAVRGVPVRGGRLSGWGLRFFHV